MYGKASRPRENIPKAGEGLEFSGILTGGDLLPHSSLWAPGRGGATACLP